MIFCCLNTTKARLGSAWKPRGPLVLKQRCGLQTPLPGEEGGRGQEEGDKNSGKVLRTACPDMSPTYFLITQGLIFRGKHPVRSQHIPDIYSLGPAVFQPDLLPGGEGIGCLLWAGLWDEHVIRMSYTDNIISLSINI